MCSVANNKMKIRTDAMAIFIYAIGIQLLIVECYFIAKFIEFLEC